MAAAAVSVLRCASEARGEGTSLRPASVAILLRVCEGSAESGDAEHLRLGRELVQAAPNSSLAQARLAVESANALESAPAAMQEQLRREASNAADTALRLNPHNGTAAAVKAFLLAPRQTLAEQEHTLLEFLQRSPDTPELNSLYAAVLREVGRNEEAVAYLERAFAQEPLSPYRANLLAWELAVTGRNDDAQKLLNRMSARWPEDQDFAWNRLRIAIYFGTRTEALRALANDPTHNAQEKACWRTAIDGLAATSRTARASAATATAHCLINDPGQAVQVLAALGDNDGAFALGERAIAQNNSLVFFVPATSALRRDPRFLPLMQRAGLATYWLQTNHWPDFCSDPQLPYQCRAEAARLSNAR